MSIMKQAIPNSVIKTKRNLPWLNKSIIQSIRRRNKLFKQAKRTGDFSKYKRARNKTLESLRLAKRRYLLQLSPKHPKRFWKTMKFLNRRVKSVPTLNNDSEIACSSRDKANMLNIFFANCFNTIFPPLSASATLPHSNPSEEILCTEDEVFHLLSSLDVTKASGPDGISPKMLKYTAASVTPIITKLFNLSITSGKIPLRWKQAHVVPIPKTSVATSPSCYRPISLIPVISKVLERHVSNLIMDHLNQNDLICDHQWGFLEGRSTVTALIKCTDDWFRALEHGQDVCAIYFDFRKAFDSVPHQTLMQKVARLGIDDCLLTWIHNYLCNRTQLVVVDGEESDTVAVMSGVPQGSVLGPLLFLIYISDLPNAITIPSAIVNLFADDVLLYHFVSSVSDFLKVQESICCIEQWSSSNHLTLNALKCKHMLISRKRNPIKPVHPLVLNGENLAKVDSYKYLGILLTSDLTWSSHISDICAKARQILGLIYRRFYGYADSDTIKQLYVSIVRPHLEYGSQVWDPHLSKDKSALENVQKFACRIASAQWDASYDDLLEFFELQSLQERRLHAKLSLLFKIIHKLCFYPEGTFNVREHSYSNRVSHQFQLSVPFAHTNSFLYSFVPHTSSIWNSLSHESVSAPSVNAFKRTLCS